MRKNTEIIELNFFIGDVRDEASLDLAMRNVDYVFHLYYT